MMINNKISMETDLAFFLIVDYMLLVTSVTIIAFVSQQSERGIRLDSILVFDMNAMIFHG